MDDLGEASDVVDVGVRGDEVVDLLNAHRFQRRDHLPGGLGQAGVQQHDLAVGRGKHRGVAGFFAAFMGQLQVAGCQFACVLCGVEYLGVAIPLSGRGRGGGMEGEDQQAGKQQRNEGLKASDLHFIAALLMPVMMYFCRIRNRRMMGTIASTAPAMISL